MITPGPGWPSAPDASKYLGLTNQVSSIDVADIPGQSGVVAWNGSHAVFVDTRKGRTWTDAWGERRPYDGTNEVDAADNALTNAFYFR